MEYRMEYISSAAAVLFPVNPEEQEAEHDA